MSIKTHLTTALPLFLLAFACQLEVHATAFIGVTTNGKDTKRVTTFSTETSAAINSFNESAVIYGTETFENFSGFSSTFGGVTMTINNNNNQLVTVASATATDGVGDYPTSGVNFWFSQNHTTRLTFSSKITAFSVFLTDLCDKGGTFTVAARNVSANGTVLSTVETFTLSLANYKKLNGNLLFLGITEATPFNQIYFYNEKSTDGFGMDDVAIGQAVPEPSTYGLMAGAALAGLGFLRRRKARNA